MIFIVTLTILVHSSVDGQTPRQFNVDQAVNYGLNNHSRITNEEKNLEYQQWLTRKEKSNYLPSVNASADYRYNTNLPVTILPSDAFGQQDDGPLEIQMGTRNSLQGGINLEQQVYDPVVRSRIKEKEIQNNLAEVSIASVKKDVAIAIKRDYYQAVFNAEMWNTSREIRENYIALEKAIRIQFENGLISEHELHNITQKKENQVEEVSINRLKYQNAVEQLKMSMDYPSENELTIADSLVVSLVSEGSANRTDSLTFRKLPAYKDISLRENLNEARIMTLAKQYHPRLSAYGFMGAQYYDDVFQPFRNDNRWYRHSYLGLKLQMSIFQGLKKNRQKQALNIRGDILTEKRMKLVSYLQRREEILKKKMLIASKIAVKKKNDYMFSYDNFTDRIRNFENGLTDYENVSLAEIEMMLQYQGYLNSLINVLNARLEYEEVISVY